MSSISLSMFIKMEDFTPEATKVIWTTAVLELVLGGERLQNSITYVRLT